MVTWRAVGAGIVELVETPPKLDRRHRKMGTLWWRTLGMADPGVADPGDGGFEPSLHSPTTSLER